MPDQKARKRSLKQQDEREPLIKRGLRDSPAPEAPQTRGDRKRASLNETRVPIEQGGRH